MNRTGNRYRIMLQFLTFIGGVIIFAGCAHMEAPGKEFADRSIRNAAILEKRGDLVNAIEELKVALAVDPANQDVREKLERMGKKRDLQAEGHFRAGLRLRDSDLPGARRELLKAIRIRNDYPDAEKALRGVQYALAEAVIHSRNKKEAALAEQRMHGKTEAEEEEEDGGGEEYSLDTAINSFEARHYETAIREFEKMKARYPNDQDIQAYLDRSWYNSGMIWFNKGDCKRALACFAKVPKGFERVDEYAAKCRTALKLPDGEKSKQPAKKRR